MRIIIIGYGVQGQKRLKVAQDTCVAVVDPYHEDANYKDLNDVKPDSFDAAIVCTPDKVKLQIIHRLLNLGKHVLVEKPLLATAEELQELQGLARAKNVLVQTAYNHRFEPHFVRMRDLLASGELGDIYSYRTFYGNGTARLVRNSPWRDQGSGVLFDLGSHLLDTYLYWFKQPITDFKLLLADKHENKAPDNAVIYSKGSPSIIMEMSLLSWRNEFYCDIFGSKGSAHICSLCKWGKTIFTHRERVLPSGKPIEKQYELEQADPTWELEYQAFLAAIKQRIITNMQRDIYISNTIKSLDIMNQSINTGERELSGA